MVIQPFKIVSDDRGYQATNTMSDTRLNTKPEDVLAAVPVVTKQQMIAPPLLDMNDGGKCKPSPARLPHCRSSPLRAEHVVQPLEKAQHRRGAYALFQE